MEESIRGVVKVKGLPGVKLKEMVMLESGEVGEVLALDEDGVEVLIFGEESVPVGMKAVRMGNQLAVAVGEELLGMTLDGLGRPISGQEGKSFKAAYLVDVVPVGIGKRRKINRRLDTGQVIVDMLIPLGRGQRELVIGDRKTGKSVVTLSTMVAQARSGGVCVYAAVGRQKTDIKKVEQFVKGGGIEKQTVIVAASSQDCLGEIFMAPFTAMAVCEYFRDMGRDVLLVLDDLTTHAKFYRELSLVLRRFPGRDAYPGDIFHVHSRLLERAGNFWVLGANSGKGGEVAITALPIAETVQGDIAGYIPTNLMSMTDGHIYFDADLFFRGRRPAIDPFVSVTRVGHQTQSPLEREITGEITNLLGQYERTQSFLRFGTELGESSRQILAIGSKVLVFFDQPLLSVVPRDLQKLLFGLLWAGAWNGREMEKILSWYEGDEKVRREVGEIVSESQTLATLVTSVRQKSDLFGQLLSR